MGTLFSALMVLAPVLAAAPNAEKSDKVKADFALHQVEENIVVRTNAERARYGLPPLKIDRNLVQSARRHTTWMTSAHTLQHTSAPVAENIAMGQRDSTEAVRCWMNSSGHRANILNPSYRRIGVAAFISRNGQIFWCQQFQP